MRLGIRPLKVKQHGFSPADLGRQLLVTLHLTGLPFETFDLGVELAEDVRQSRQIVLRRLEPQLRLVPAAVEAGDAGGVFQNASPLLGFGVDNLADLALADERGRTCPGGRILEQDLDVAGTHIAAVDAVGRTGLALDPARDLDAVAVVELGRRSALAVVEEDRHLGGIARGPRRRAREDDVVHGGGTHGLMRRLAHHPAQCFEQVRLATAIRADDPGQPLLDEEVGGLDERLEAKQPEPLNVHLSRISRSRPRAR